MCVCVCVMNVCLCVCACVMNVCVCVCLCMCNECVSVCVSACLCDRCNECLFVHRNVESYFRQETDCLNS